jgi:cell wall-associated NlpC family hydrolase
VKKLCFYAGLAALFFVLAGNGFAQTIQFEYDVSQKYPIYIMFEGNIGYAWETTAWYPDEKSWHYNENEWTWDDKTQSFYYSGPDQDNDAHWIIDNGVDFYIGPDDPNNAYAYLNNTKNDWEMFRMSLSDQNTIYATGNIVFDRIGGKPSKDNPYSGQWRSREDDTLVVTFNPGNTCKMEVTNSYKNTPLVAKPAVKPAAPAPVKKSESVSPAAPVNGAKSTINAGGNTIRDKIVEAAKSHLNARYRYGKEGTKEYDCSGFVMATYKEATGMTLPRSSVLMNRAGKHIKFSEMKPGDIIVFGTEKKGMVNHVGIYIGDNNFIHAWGPGGEAKVVLHSRDRPSMRTVMKNMELGYLRFLND